MYSESPYKCLDAFKCATTAPGTDADVWEALDRATTTYRIGYFETNEAIEVPCVPWETYIVDFNSYKLFDNQDSDVVNLEPNPAIAAQDVTYLCWEGRAVECADTTVVSGEMACVTGGDPATNSSGWIMKENATAEEQQPFSTKYPHCLPGTQIPDDVSGEAQPIQDMVAALKFIEAQEAPLVWMIGEVDPNDSMSHSYIYWPEAYGETLPIYVDKNGNLCTNMETVGDESTQRIMLAFNDGIFDMTIPNIDDTTDPANYPANVAVIAANLSKDDFDSWASGQKKLDGTDSDGNACTACVPFTTYWDMLSAIAKAPAFCAGAKGPMYSRVSDGAMCAKEFSGMAAVMVTQTNKWDANAVDADGNPIGYEFQGFHNLFDARCDPDQDTSASGYADNMTYCAQFTPAYEGELEFYANKSLDPNNKGFYPRGAGWLYGPDQYYWMSRLVYGDSTITDDPDLLNTDAKTWWMSGLLRWMIPMNGLPAPHNIIYGQWEATNVETDAGITEGFGAVSSLLYGAEQCGIKGHPKANARTAIYEYLMNMFGATEAILEWEANDCASSSRAAFPTGGDYTNVPQFATYKVRVIGDIEDSSSAVETRSESCYIISQRSDYIVWEKDSFRQCVIDNLADLAAEDDMRR